MRTEPCLFSMAKHSAPGTEQAGAHRSEQNSLRHAPPHSVGSTEGKVAEKREVSARTLVTPPGVLAAQSLRHGQPGKRGSKYPCRRNCLPSQARYGVGELRGVQGGTPRDGTLIPMLKCSI